MDSDLYHIIPQRILTCFWGCNASSKCRGGCFRDVCAWITARRKLHKTRFGLQTDSEPGYWTQTGPFTRINLMQTTL